MLLPSQILPNTPAYDYQAHLASVRAVWEQYPLRSTEQIDKHLARLAKEVRQRLRRPVHDEAIIEFMSEIVAILYADRVYLDEFPSYLSADELKVLQQDLCQERIDAATSAFTELCIGFLENIAPSPALEDPEAAKDAICVPMIELCGGSNDLVAAIVGFFATRKLPGSDRLLFPITWKTIYRNICLVSGYNPDEMPEKPKLIFPHDSDSPPVLAVTQYLNDTGLEDYLLQPTRFVIPEETRFSGHWIVAPPGRGKTTLLHSIVMEDVKKDASLVLIDSKGDLIDPLKKLASLKDRLILIEPSADHAFALNPLDVSHTNVTQVVNLIEYIMAGLLDAKFTALQSTLFRNVVPAIIEAIPNPTLDTFKEVIVKGLPAASLAQVNPHARQFFESRETGFHSKTYESTRKEVVWRLDYLLTNPTLRSMFSATHTKLDIGKEMDAGKVIIINNSKAILGDEGAEFFGRFFIALIARAAQQRSGRPPASKKPCYVYIDECQTVISKDTRIPTLLDECRSQKIGLILAHQRTAQLSAPVLDAVANCAIRMANSDDEARYLADKLRTNTEFLRSLPRGTFAAFVRDTTQSAISINVPHIRVDRFPQMTDAEQRELRDRMQTQFTAPAISSKPAPPPQPPDPTQTPPSAEPDPKSQAAKTTTEVAKPQAAPDADDPQTGDHTEPASKWDKK